MTQTTETEQHRCCYNDSYNEKNTWGEGAGGDADDSQLFLQVGLGTTVCPGPPRRHKMLEGKQLSPAEHWQN